MTKSSFRDYTLTFETAARTPHLEVTLDRSERQMREWKEKCHEGRKEGKRRNKPLLESGYLRFSVLRRETVESSWGRPGEQSSTVSLSLSQSVCIPSSQILH